MVIQRPADQARVSKLLKQFPVVAIVGPRQVGKTTLALELSKAFDVVHHFDLEDPQDLARLQEPGLALRPLEGLVIIDEVQRKPDLFPLLRVLADRKDTSTKFLILGSASPELIQDGSESLAGRIAFHELAGFSLGDVGPDYLDNLWVRGGYPRSFLSMETEYSVEWREQFIKTYLERDLSELGFGIPSTTLRRFWSMLAHYHGQTLNYSELGRSLPASDNTVRSYVDILASTYMVMVLQPWFENISKRQVKSPKIYIRDSGLFHTLLGIDTKLQLERHPKLGASWEGFALMEIIRRHPKHDPYFWATHAGAELDLMLVRGDERLGFEFKRTDSPKATRSMHTALTELKLNELTVIHGGSARFPLADNIEAVGLSSLKA